MEVKKIFSVLSENETAISYTSFLFENRAEKVSFLAFLILAILYVVLLFLDYKFIALISALFSILSLLFHSIASFARDKELFFYPIRSYVKELHKGIESEKEILEKLSKFSVHSLTEAKTIAEYERDRIKNNVSFLSGSIEKVGIFPSFLAFFYAFHKYQSSPDASFLANIILGLILGVYFGVLLLQRISTWQNGCIYLLNQAIEAKENSNQSPRSSD